MNHVLLAESADSSALGVLPLNRRPHAKFLHQKKSVPCYVLYSLVALCVIATIAVIVLASLLVSQRSAGTPAPPGNDANNGNVNDVLRADSNVTADLPNVLLPIVPSYPPNTLPGQIKTYNLLHHLSGLYGIAMDNGGNRVITGTGFNASVDYIYNQVLTKTNLINVEKSYFYRSAGSQTFVNPSLSAQVVGQKYPINYGSSDFRVWTNSASYSNDTYVNAVYIPNNGCYDSDWQTAVQWPNPPVPYFAVVERSTTGCTDTNRIGLAQNYEASGIILVQVNSTAGPASGSAPTTTTITVMSVSFPSGQPLISALKADSTVMLYANVYVNKPVTVITNLCADTPQGDPTSVVLVGGHSDGVSAGPGTNDDGSGAIATLTLAIALTKLMQNTSAPYKLTNMVKFCWFGAEEQGLLGSYEVVRVAWARNSDPNARIGSRAKDWAIMIDLDMLGSMNFQNYIYDANQYVPPRTPVSAINGSKILSNLFFDFYNQNDLPSNSDRFDGRSDYGPFLEIGIPAGGVDAGADKVKSEAERQRYQRMTGWGGVANQINDQCYHRACDTIAHIHWGVYTNMTMAAAYATEQLYLRQNLRQWLGNPVESVRFELPYPQLPFEFNFGSGAHREHTGEEPTVVYDAEFTF